jgi:hypothetical protein
VEAYDLGGGVSVTSIPIVRDVGELSRCVEIEEL